MAGTWADLIVGAGIGALGLVIGTSTKREVEDIVEKLDILEAAVRELETLIDEYEDKFYQLKDKYLAATIDWDEINREKQELSLLEADIVAKEEEILEVIGA